MDTIPPTTSEYLFSVVISTYNRASKLPRCLDSVLRYQLLQTEAVVVNDASTDNTKELLNEYKEQYGDRITIIDHPVRTERVIAYKHGIAAARGEYITHLGSDDHLEKCSLSLVVPYLKEEPKLLNFDQTVYTKNGAVLRKGRQFTREDTIRSGMIAAAQFMWHKSVTDEIRLPNAKNCYEFADLAGIPGYCSQVRTLGNPWGEDFYIFWRLTRSNVSTYVPIILSVVHIRGSE